MSDIAGFLAYRQDPEVRLYQGWKDTTEESAQVFIEDMETLQFGAVGQWFQIAVALKASDELIGDVAIHLREQEPYQAVIGYTLSQSYQGKGYATEAVTGLLRYAFEELGLHRVMASVYAENTRSIKLLERVGMRREGYYLQSSWFQDKQWVDEATYAILRDDWVKQLAFQT